MTIKSTLFAAAALSIALSGVGAPAFAGEVTGNGKPTPIKTEHRASSICAFSGLDDNSPEEGGDGTVTPGVTQSWGQIPKAERDFLQTVGAHPGDACRGNAQH